MLCVGDNEWLQDAAGGQKTTAGTALDFVILIALCGMAFVGNPPKTQFLRKLNNLLLIGWHLW